MFGKARDELWNNPLYRTMPNRSSTFVQFKVADSITKIAPKMTSSKQQSAISIASGNQGAIERMYRRFWSRKGDVFHLLLALALALDDRYVPLVSSMTNCDWLTEV